VGTSGWQYDHWRGPFYPPELKRSRWFGHYASLLDTVEVNATFHGLPSEPAALKWRRAAPPGFVYAVKASRFITHVKRLKAAKAALDLFLERMSGLGDMLGPVLFQLPPRFPRDTSRLEAFLSELPSGLRAAFEFRDRSWFTDDVYRLLEKRGVALCVYDLEGYTSPEAVTAGFVYARLHGPGAAYQGSYAAEALAAWAGRMERWAASGLDAYCYCNNDQSGHAALNAMELLAILKRREAASSAT